MNVSGMLNGGINLVGLLALAAVLMPGTAQARDNSAAVEVVPVAESPSADGQACCRCDARNELRFFGPVALVNQQPPNPAFLSPIPAVATVLPPGEEWARFKVDLTNHLTMESDAGYVMRYDFESLRFEPEYHIGLSQGELSVRYMFGYTGPGFLDGFIRSFHQLIDQRSWVRMDTESYHYECRLEGPQGVIFEGETDEWYFGDLVAEFKRPLFNKRNGEDALSWRAAVKIPISILDNELLDTGGMDYSLGLLYQRQLGRRWRGYLNLDYVLISPTDWDQVSHNNIVVMLYAVEYAINPRTTGVVQWRTHPNPVSLGGDQIDQDSQELSYAVHHDLGGGTVLTFGMTEDVQGQSAPDVSFMGYLSWEM